MEADIRRYGSQRVCYTHKSAHLLLACQLPLRQNDGLVCHAIGSHNRDQYPLVWSEGIADAPVQLSSCQLQLNQRVGHGLHAASAAFPCNNSAGTGCAFGVA